MKHVFITIVLTIVSLVLILCTITTYSYFKDRDIPVHYTILCLDCGEEYPHSPIEYCSDCGSDNLALYLKDYCAVCKEYRGGKYCTKCGSNLGIVREKDRYEISFVELDKKRTQFEVLVIITSIILIIEVVEIVLSLTVWLNKEEEELYE